MIVAGRGARRLLNAAMSGAIAVLSIAVLSIAVLGVAVLGVAVLGVAGPVAAAHPAAAYPRPQLTEPQVDPTPEPTPTDLPTTPPPPPPAPGVKINAADVTLGPSYWQGSVTKGAMTVQVTNTGDSAELVTLTYTLPPGVHDTGPACPCTATLKAGDVWTVNVVLAVGRADLGARDQDGYSIMLPPGPPVPGVSLTASDLFLAAVPPARSEIATLTVKLANTGSVPVVAAIELITPDGVNVASFPTACQSRRRIAAHRERCELGRVDAGTGRSLTFNLSISALARGEAPLR